MIRIAPDEHGVLVYHWKVLSDGRREYTTWEQKTKVIKEGDKAPWWLVLGTEDAKALASALADWSGDQQPELGYYQGLLEAMRTHLDDMRKLNGVADL